MASSYLSPGVYVEEVSGGVKPIAGVGTSTGAFVGIAERGVMGKAVLITNWNQFVSEFGGFIADGFLAYGVFSFFAEGGTSCYVVRTCHYTTGTPITKTSVASAKTLLDDTTPTAGNSMRITASSDGKWGDKISVTSGAATNIDAGFKLTIYYKNAKGEDVQVESFDDMTMTPDSINDVNSKSAYIRLEKDSWKEGGNSVTGSGKIPKKDQTVTLEGGDDGLKDLTAPADYIGDGAARNGLHAFDIVDDINIVAIPDAQGNHDTMSQAITYCGNRKDCIFIADSLTALKPTDVRTYRSGFNSSYGALYYPWVYISDPLTGKRKLIPPSGAVAGTYAHTDSVRGVHKAPAGISEGYLDSVIGVETIVTKGEHDILNPIGINVIRSLPSGITIWGARTLSADSEWNYVNVRRLFMFLEESIDKGTQWVVFEPNDPKLWGSVRRNLAAFLTRVWRDGALYGTTPDEAFFIKVDEENNPPAVRDAGQLIIEVGVAPVKPAEFVIIRISQKTLTK